MASSIELGIGKGVGETVEAKVRDRWAAAMLQKVVHTRSRKGAV